MDINPYYNWLCFFHSYRFRDCPITNGWSESSYSSIRNSKFKVRNPKQSYLPVRVPVCVADATGRSTQTGAIPPARLAWASQQKDEEHWVQLAMAGRSAFHIRRSILNVRCLMFKLLLLKLRLNLHITLKLHIQVRSSEMKKCYRLFVWEHPIKING